MMKSKPSHNLASLLTNASCSKALRHQLEAIGEAALHSSEAATWFWCDSVSEELARCPKWLGCFLPNLCAPNPGMERIVSQLYWCLLTSHLNFHVKTQHRVPQAASDRSVVVVAGHIYTVLMRLKRSKSVERRSTPIDPKRSVNATYYSFRISTFLRSQSDSHSSLPEVAKK